MKSRMKRLGVVVVLLIIVLLISVGFVLLNLWERHNRKYPGEIDVPKDSITYNSAEYVLKDNIDTFLILGLDKYDGESSSDSYNNDKQADFLMLLVFDNELKQCTAIHINRDTMVDVNVLGVAGERIDTITKQIALAHTYGNGRDVSCRNTADSVSALLNGIKIDHYISLTLDSVAVFNDLVGGVEITVLDDFTGIDDTLVKGETVTLTGDQALHYVRTRNGLEDSTNSTRMKRQQQYLNALYDQIRVSIEADEDFIVNASLKMSDYMVSDRSVTQLQELAKKFNEYELVEIKEIDGESILGEKYMEFYPNENSVMEIVIGCFYEIKD